MALTPQNNEVFMREVDEELRRDQLMGFWTRYGRIVAVVVVLALVALGGWFYWQHRQNVQAGEQGVAYDKVLEDLAADRTDAVKAPLAELAASDVEGYRAMARFVEGDVLLKNDDLKGAAAKFAGIAADTSLARPYRDLALIRQTAAEYDTLPPAQVVDRLKGLAVKDSAWFGSAGEMVAVAYVRMNRPADAGKLFGEIAGTENVPETIRQRAVQMAGLLGVDAVTEPAQEKKKAE
ncbi:tetratricopeptide repeat protein [Sphingomonas sp.]|uniref:tetratricopeptide repeat protein n=1 Tax=Sphingomonas sp. TaxID=28214 RepID=UPI002B5D72FC|nr:tetratricopeptide repeat protein [Sphingomonas sp.]HTG39518.1 tetratricopeptide repeat protein [Sphingomonas sp.]